MNNIPTERKPFSSLKDDLSVFLPDLYIGFASFEERSVENARHVSDSVSNAIVCCFEPVMESVRQNLEKIGDFFTSVEQASFSHEDPFEGIDNILDCLKRNDWHSKNILVDITTFSREALLTLMSAIDVGRPLKFDNIMFLYSPASGYDPNNKLSFGVKNIRSVLGFPGRQDPLKQTHLIVMTGYEDERAIKIVEAFEPSKLMLGFGGVDGASSPEIFENNINTYNKLNDILLPEYGPDSFEFSLNDPHKTKDQILNIIDESYNNIIVPMNNKISCLGAGLAALENRELQIVYAQPETYNYINYSQPSDDYYLFRIQYKNECSTDKPVALSG